MRGKWKSDKFLVFSSWKIPKIWILSHRFHCLHQLLYLSPVEHICIVIRKHIRNSPSMIKLRCTTNQQWNLHCRRQWKELFSRFYVYPLIAIFWARLFIEPAASCFPRTEIKIYTVSTSVNRNLDCWASRKQKFRCSSRNRVEVLEGKISIWGRLYIKYKKCFKNFGYWGSGRCRRWFSCNNKSFGSEKKNLKLHQCRPQTVYRKQI